MCLFPKKEVERRVTEYTTMKIVEYICQIDEYINIFHGREQFKNKSFVWKNTTTHLVCTLAHSLPARSITLILERRTLKKKKVENIILFSIKVSTY